jgi:hypothetical protein
LTDAIVFLSSFKPKDVKLFFFFFFFFFGNSQAYKIIKNGVMPYLSVVGKKNGSSLGYYFVKEVM